MLLPIFDALALVRTVPKRLHIILGGDNDATCIEFARGCQPFVTETVFLSPARPGSTISYYNANGFRVIFLDPQHYNEEARAYLKNCLDAGTIPLVSKGTIESPDFGRICLGFLASPERLASHTTIFNLRDCKYGDKNREGALFLADAGLVPLTKPDRVGLIQDDLRQIVTNTIRVASALYDRELLYAAMLASLEKPNLANPITVIEHNITEECGGRILGVLVDGPLAFDCAIDPDDAAHKNLGDRPVAGRANMFFYHDVNAANEAAKMYMKMKDGEFHGFITELQFPTVMPSRSEGIKGRICSAAAASTAFHRMVESSRN